MFNLAFVAAPTAETCGNLSGSVGPRVFGPMGYPMTDVAATRVVVAVTDHLVPYPAPRIDIPEARVDFVVEVPRLGDASGIVSGTTRPTTDPVSRKIAEDEASGVFRGGFSLQTGAAGQQTARRSFGWRSPSG